MTDTQQLMNGFMRMAVDNRLPATLSLRLMRQIWSRKTLSCAVKYSVAKVAPRTGAVWY